MSWGALKSQALWALRALLQHGCGPHYTKQEPNCFSLLSHLTLLSFTAKLNGKFFNYLSIPRLLVDQSVWMVIKYNGIKRADGTLWDIDRSLKHFYVFLKKPNYFSLAGGEWQWLCQFGQGRHRMGIVPQGGTVDLLKWGRLQGLVIHCHESTPYSQHIVHSIKKALLEVYSSSHLNIEGWQNK